MGKALSYTENHPKLIKTTHAEVPKQKRLLYLSQNPLKTSQIHLLRKHKISTANTRHSFDTTKTLTSTTYAYQSVEFNTVKVLSNSLRYMKKEKIFQWLAPKLVLH